MEFRETRKDFELSSEYIIEILFKIMILSLR